jgi:hypothetical protein
MLGLMRWHRMGQPKRKRQGLKLSGWPRKEQERSRRPSRQLKIGERQLCHWEVQFCLRLGWMLPWAG